METKNLSGMRQDLSRKLVEREVIHSANYLMQGIRHLMDVAVYADWREAFSEDQDETRQLFERYDYEEAARQFVMVDADLDDLEAVADEYASWGYVLGEAKVPEVWADEPDEDGDTLWGIKDSNAVHDAVYADEDDAREAAIESVLPAIREAVWKLVEDAHDDAFKEVCDEHSLDVDTLEVYEHWIVSDWLGRKLKARGEIIQDFAGFTLWGRCTTGQAIYLDGVIEEITAELWPQEWAGEVACP